MRQIHKDPAWLDDRWDRSDIRKDLRRKWERLLNRAKFLDDTDRRILELVADQNGRTARLARLTRQNPAVLNRRIRDIARRLNACELQAILEHPDDFTRFEKACIRQHLIRKHPLARAAADLGTTVYTLRKTIALARVKAHRLCETPKNPNPTT